MRRAKFALLALVILVLLDVGWITYNVQHGAYRGLVNGRVTSRQAIAALWACVLLAEVALLTHMAAEAPSLAHALGAGALAGFAIYFTFNATALVTFSTWTASAAIVDTMWGTVLLATASAGAWHLASGRACCTTD